MHIPRIPLGVPIRMDSGEGPREGYKVAKAIKDLGTKGKEEKD